MIPKKIHYCWFSGKKMPKEFEYYMESWRRHCPDYQIIRWDESNYDIGKNRYMESAYKEKRWGFVPDYARFDIIYREGGIYLDTDVEILKPLDDLLDNPCFFGNEDELHINPGLGFGAEKGNPVIGELRDMYDNLSFYQEDGTMNLTPSPEYVTRKLREMGIKMNNGIIRQKDVTIYPTEYLGAMDYCSGIINKTENTYSIHHFSCTWMTREEKKAEERRRNFCNTYGNFMGNRIDGIYKRIAKRQIIRDRSYVPVGERIVQRLIYSEKKNRERLDAVQPSEDTAKFPFNKAVMLSPAVNSINLGDSIIEAECIKQLDMLQKDNICKVSTHLHPDSRQIKCMKEADVVLVAGSNLLGGDVNHNQWKLPKDFTALSQLCLMGCGWSNYGECNEFSKKFYSKVLNNGWIHSARDRYTVQQLKDAGVRDVLYTGCPTMWNLTEEHCSKISAGKSESVVTALTSYQADYDRDSFMMQVLFEQYRQVYFWPQGTEDEKYLRQILTNSEKERVVILKRDIGSLKKILELEKPDYIGNRLHGGIFALNMCCRSKVIAIDNRALEIGRDTGLPVIRREDLKQQLEDCIYDNSPTAILMPWENISRWKRQFMEEENEERKN